MVAKASEETPFSKLLHELRIRIIRISISVIIVILLCMTMSLTMINFGDYRIPILYPNSLHNMSIQIISFMKETLLPKSVILIQIAPGQAFTAQIYVAILVGIIVTIPIMLRELISFIEPALYFHEKKIIKSIIFPSIGLFATGCFFSYSIVIPYTIEFLYKYGQSMGVNSFFDITQFISFVTYLLILFGFSYQFPLVMWMLTRINIVRPHFWRNSFRYAIILLIILGAFITPDGSGITMWFVVGPMVLLYIFGMIVVELKFKKNGIQ
jgi:sec-independent protein translocase protein TatC